MVAQAHGTVCINTAAVPRWREVEGARRHHFTVVDFAGEQRPRLQEVRSVWVAAGGSSAGGEGGDGEADQEDYVIVEDEQLLRADGDGSMHILDTCSGTWACSGVQSVAR